MPLRERSTPAHDHLARSRRSALDCTRLAGGWCRRRCRSGSPGRTRSNSVGSATGTPPAPSTTVCPASMGISAGRSPRRSFGPAQIGQDGHARACGRARGAPVRRARAGGGVRQVHPQHVDPRVQQALELRPGGRRRGPGWRRSWCGGEQTAIAERPENRPRPRVKVALRPDCLGPRRSDVGRLPAFTCSDLSGRSRRPPARARCGGGP